MIPLNAQEASDLLRHHARQIAQSERQIAHFRALAANERLRLDRLKQEAEHLEAMASGAALLPGDAA